MRCAVLLLASVLLLEREQHGGQALVVHASVLRMGTRDREEGGGDQRSSH